MELGSAVRTALEMLLTADPRVVGPAAMSLQVSLLATLFAAVLGLPVGFLVATSDFRGRSAVRLVLNTLTAVPTVVVGLLAYMLLSRRGLFGSFGLLYTPAAMVIGETALVTPLVAALTMAVVGGADPRITETALTLGASRLRAAFTVLSEVRLGILGAIAATFGRLISELGVALMVGGNIEGATRTMTTAIALETGKGEFALGFALGLILLALALAVNVVVWVLSPRQR